MKRNVLQRLRTNPVRQLAVLLLCLLAFEVQTHVAQTHVHACAQSGAVPVAQLADAGDACALPADQPGESREHRGGENPASCALCQVAMHGGAVPLFTAAAAMAPQSAVSLASPAQLPCGAVAAVSHSWQSRAPPV